MGINGPDKVDVHVGRRLRIARKEAGVSQTKLAEALGITFQQVQKYEHAKNRISPSRLAAAAATLGKTIGWFYGEEDKSGAQREDTDLVEKMLIARNGVELASIFISIEVALQDALLDCARALSGRTK